MFDRIVIDTNVFVSALRSSAGASYLLMALAGKGRFDFANIEQFGLQTLSPQEFLKRMGEIL